MQKTGFTSFSDFGGGGGGGGPLPIVLTSWDVEIIGESASLEWTVESQINNDYYTIHKSLDGYEWEEVARIPGAGNTNTTMHYQIFDEKPYVGQSYYRLMQTDYDGKFEIFNMIGVFWDKPIALSINPNPVQEVLTLYLSETLRGVTHVTIFELQTHVLILIRFIMFYLCIQFRYNLFWHCFQFKFDFPMKLYYLRILHSSLILTYLVQAKKVHLMNFLSVYLKEYFFHHLN